MIFVQTFHFLVCMLIINLNRGLWFPWKAGIWTVGITGITDVTDGIIHGSGFLFKSILTQKKDMKPNLVLNYCDSKFVLQKGTQLK